MSHLSNVTNPTDILDAVRALAPGWHGAGTIRGSVLERLVFHALPRRFGASTETGTGRSTLILSHLFQHHTVFTKDDEGDGDSLRRVRESDLLARERVQFVVGFTQQTLPRHIFAHRFQYVLIDGPHGYPFPELEYCFLYPHIEIGGMLVVDDIQIPTVRHLFDVLREDAMWQLVEVAHTTAFFERTNAPVFDPTGDGWWSQGYNRRHLPLVERAKRYIPASIRRALRHLVDPH